MTNRVKNNSSKLKNAFLRKKIPLSLILEYSAFAMNDVRFMELATNLIEIENSGESYTTYERDYERLWYKLNLCQKRFQDKTGYDFKALSSLGQANILIFKSIRSGATEVNAEYAKELFANSIYVDVGN